MQRMYAPTVTIPVTDDSSSIVHLVAFNICADLCQMSATRTPHYGHPVGDGDSIVLVPEQAH
jgi:hypothetical protein